LYISFIFYIFKSSTAGFIWTIKNVEHIAEHGITPEEAEQVVTKPARSYPHYKGDGKWLARGQTTDGRYIQVIYLRLADADEIDCEQVDLVLLDDSEDTFVVIHARPLTESERSALKRKRKRR
jgi:hypothetical protein